MQIFKLSGLRSCNKKLRPLPTDCKPWASYRQQLSSKLGCWQQYFRDVSKCSKFQLRWNSKPWKWSSKALQMSWRGPSRISSTSLVWNNSAGEGPSKCHGCQAVGCQIGSPHGGITILHVEIGQNIREASNKQTVDFDWIASRISFIGSGSHGHVKNCPNSRRNRRDALWDT